MDKGIKCHRKELNMSNPEDNKVQTASKCAFSRFGTVCRLTLDKCVLLDGAKTCSGYEDYTTKEGK